MDVNSIMENAKLRVKLGNMSADSFISSEFDSDSIDFDAITEEKAQDIIRRAIDKKNIAMDKALDDGLSERYDKKRIHFMSKDKYIAMHKRRILEIERSIMEMLNLDWYDREFLSDLAKNKIGRVLYDLKDELGKDWIDYQFILISRYSKAYQARNIYNRLAFFAKNANLDAKVVTNSMIRDAEFRSQQSREMLGSCKKVLTLTREYRN